MNQKSRFLRIFLYLFVEAASYFLFKTQSEYSSFGLQCRLSSSNRNYRYPTFVENIENEISKYRFRIYEVFLCLKCIKLFQYN